MASTIQTQVDLESPATRRRPPSVFPVLRQPPSVLPAARRPPSIFDEEPNRPPSIIDTLLETAELLDMAGAAARLDTTVEEIDALVRGRRITHYEADGVIKFDCIDLDAWLLKHGPMAKPSRRRLGD